MFKRNKKRNETEVKCTVKPVQMKEGPALEWARRMCDKKK